MFSIWVLISTVVQFNSQQLFWLRTFKNSWIYYPDICASLSRWHFLLDIGHKLNIHKTFWRCPRHPLNVLCTLNSHPMSRGLSWFAFIWLFLNQVNNFSIKLDNFYDNNTSEVLTVLLILNDNAAESIMCEWVSCAALTEAYSQPCQTSKMKLFAKLVSCYQPFTKSSILDVWQGFKVLNTPLFSILLIFRFE